MSRKLKFRIWNPTYQEMLYPSSPTKNGDYGERSRKETETELRNVKAAGDYWHGKWKEACENAEIKHKEICELKRERNRLIDAWPVFEAVMGLRKQRDQWRECAEGLAQALWQERPSLEIPSARHSALIEFERLKENSK